PSAPCSSTPTWQSTSALTTTSKLPSAKGSRSTEPTQTGHPLLRRATPAAPGSSSRPTVVAPGTAAARRARKPPVPQPASRIAVAARRSRRSAGRRFACRPRTPHIAPSARARRSYSLASTGALQAAGDGGGPPLDQRGAAVDHFGEQRTHALDAVDH